ncbi:alpha/beta fold hydrolase [Pseudonocardia sp. MH-G8]|uniref:alpha/beta fold hydrolase n=1 Tax=Pseudonocardia sp. MH-G8 TaxID=1854588 RepID=UPI000BA0BEDA|nr:alpha/beta fold hydrolase [Pseudonocardia sp. MH-G8]OZM79285.1 3-oxoadipate enol-lactonase [Pseudonocardia sp. MH-G8]
MTTRSSGRGTVVLLHSLGTDHGLWEAQVPALQAAGYDVLAPDSAGHGGDRGPGPRDLTDWVDEVDAAVPADGAHLVGLSMGGVQALAYALAHPDRIRSLVLANTFAELDTAVAETKIAGIVSAVGEQGMPAYALTYLRDTLTVDLEPERRERLRASIAAVAAPAYLASARTCFRVGLRDRLPEVSAPTLVVAGADDRKTPLPLAETLRDGIGGARLVSVRDAGHLSCVEAPEAFTAAVLDFLAEHSPVPTGEAAR